MAKRRIKADEIKRIREGLGVSQRVFAERVGVSDQAIVSRWESGTHKPSPLAARRIVELRDGQTA